MVRTRCLLLAVLAVTQVGCANHGNQYADTSTARPNWACRQLDKVKERTQEKTRQDAEHGFGRGGGDAGSAVGVLIMWPILAGACAASRS